MKNCWIVKSSNGSILLLLLFLCVCAFVHVFHLIARERFSISYFVIYMYIYTCLFLVLGTITHLFSVCSILVYQRYQWGLLGTICTQIWAPSFRIYFLIILCKETCNFYVLAGIVYEGYRICVILWRV